MSVQLNHTIVWCRDKQKSATFFTDVLGLPAPSPFGPFLVVELSNGVSLDFYEIDREIVSQHYAFLIGEDDFDQVFSAFASAEFNTGPTPASGGRARSTATTADGDSTSKTPMAISWKSSPAPTAAAIV